MAFFKSTSRPRSSYGENGSPQTERERTDAIQGTKFRTSVKEDTSWINRAGGLKEDESDEPGLIDFREQHPSSPLSPTYGDSSRSPGPRSGWEDTDSRSGTKGTRDASGSGSRSSTQKWDSSGPEGSSFSRVEITETETRRGGDLSEPFGPSPPVPRNRSSGSGVQSDTSNLKDSAVTRTRFSRPGSSSSSNEQITVTERKEVYSNKSEPQETSTADNKENLWENAWRRCSRCNHALGKRTNSYILDYLGLYYHESCFKCDGCDADLGHMGAGGMLHIVSKRINCDSCYQKNQRSSSGR